MLASKSRENLAHFDLFECLSCRSVISEVRQQSPDSDKKQR
jgi:hypothetical protein